MGFNTFRNRDRNRDNNRDRHKNREDRIALGVKVYYTGESEEQRTQDLEKALSKFKKIINKEGLMLEAREREYYKSPGRKKYEKRRKWLYTLELNKNKVQQKTDLRSRNKKGYKNDRNFKA